MDILQESGGGIDISGIRPAWICVDLDSLAWNTRRIKEAAGEKTNVCAAVKADAYGHGAAQIAKTALANGADSLCVAILDEAIELRNAGVNAQILILGALERTRAREVVECGVTQTVYSVADAEALSIEAQKLSVPAVIHIKIDTGLGRLGFICDRPSVYDEIIKAASLPGIYVEGIFTHFASADDTGVLFTEHQLYTFRSIYDELARRGLKIPIRHCSNSAALAGYPDARMEMVRPGIALYGGAGRLPGSHHKNLDLRGVMSLRARITQVKNISEGDGVGYMRRFIAKRPSVIATLPVGYADGYDRGLSCGKGSVLVKGRRAPIAGTICMDQLMVDVTDIGGVKAGDEAVLYGKQGSEEITIEEIAKTLNTISYVIMCAAGRRAPRVYIRNGVPVSVRNYLTLQ